MGHTYVRDGYIEENSEEGKEYAHPQVRIAFKVVQYEKKGFSFNLSMKGECLIETGTTNRK